jgi:hypothetical protein
MAQADFLHQGVGLSQSNQSMWDLWQVEWNLARFFSKYLGVNWQSFPNIPYASIIMNE